MDKDPEELGRVLLDARVLAAGVGEDFQLKFWSGYMDRIVEFNDLLSRSHALGVGTDLQPISEVPEREKSSRGTIGTTAEQAKLREVVLTSKRLLSRIEQDFTDSGAGLEGVDTVAVAISVVTRLCDRFHAVARQIRARHANRDTLHIEDEYDVQDLFHALLKIHFDDIRAEEYTPSYAGGSARTDFLLKRERIVVEIKRTRPNLVAKGIGAELLVDIARYAHHPDCDYLLCFVYDPEGRIANPRGLERDLEQQTTSQLTVTVYIRPRD